MQRAQPQDAASYPIGQDNEATSADPAHTESAPLALAIMLHCHGIGAEPEQICHRIGSGRIGVAEMLRCAKEMDLKAQFPSARAGSGWLRPRCRASLYSGRRLPDSSR
jgi:ATP-binding cassette, subfamily B, bacterial HlyB/CyaB